MQHNHHHFECHKDVSEYKSSTHMMMKDFKKRLWVSILLTVPILFLSPMVQSILPFNYTFEKDIYIQFILSSIVFFYGGWPFIKGGYFELKEKSWGMMLLISIAIVTSYVYSTIVVLGVSGKIFFIELATLIDIMLLGHLLEMKSILGSSQALEYLVKMLPSQAHLVINNSIKVIRIEELKINDIVLVKPLDQIPCDGVVTQGVSYIDESFLTGEAKPVRKDINNKVIGGSINGNSEIKVKVSRLGKDSYLSKVINLVKEAQINKSKTQKLADKAAKWLTIITIFSGTITFLIWLLVKQNLSFGLEKMVTVMIISCPHALGLAIPLVVAISTSICAKYGLLVKNRTAFESTRKITTVVFDKTGTLTKGKFGVIKYQSLSSQYTNDQILQLAASLETLSEHPLARGIINLAKSKKLALLEPKNVKNIIGEGLFGKINNKEVLIVNPAYLERNNLFTSTIPVNEQESQVFLVIDKQVVGYINLGDEIRPESFETIKKLQKLKIKTLMITGDNENVAKYVSNTLHIDQYYSNVLPDKKLEIIKDLQKKGEFVAMTGDGINDAPALAQADIGIAIGSGTEIAAQTADIILVKSNPLDILAAIIFGKATYNKMVQNLLWATSYNIIAIPLASGMFYSYGITISPAMGAIFMTLSTIIVAINARLLTLNKALKFLQKTNKE